MTVPKSSEQGVCKFLFLPQCQSLATDFFLDSVHPFLFLLSLLYLWGVSATFWPLSSWLRLAPGGLNIFNPESKAEIGVDFLPPPGALKMPGWSRDAQNLFIVCVGGRGALEDTLPRTP